MVGARHSLAHAVGESIRAIPVAAEIVAFFQIALAELAECDLDIVPGTAVSQIQLLTSLV